MKAWGKSRPAWAQRSLAVLALSLAFCVQGAVWSRAGAQSEAAPDSAASAGASSASADSAEVAPKPSIPAGPILWTRYRGVIGTVSASYLLDALAEAKRLSAACLVIEIDTPGGLDTAMREIIQGILASDVPVVVFVSPSGARAASAGAFIALAAHVIAMAPGTNIGAAHPVSLGGEADSTMIAKVTNDSAAYIRGLATQRGKDPDWAERAVRESISADSESAMALGIADVIASGREELIAALDGLPVPGEEGERSFVLKGAPVREFAMSWRYRFLGLLNDPNIAYLLMIIGFYGIFFELSSPGAIFPGVIGGISMILGLYALQSLSINYAGLMLMVLGLVLFIVEIKVPSHGVLTVGGVTALTLGSTMLIRSPLPFLRVSLWVILPAVLVTAAFFIFAIGMALKAQKRAPRSGRRSMIGLIGEARTEIAPQGMVFVAGTHWQAESEVRIEAGQPVEVIAVEGMKLKVRPPNPERKETI